MKPIKRCSMKCLGNGLNKLDVPYRQPIEPALIQIVDCRGHSGVDQGFLDDRLDLLPCPSSQAAADSRHVNAGSHLLGVIGNCLKSSFDGLVTDRWNALSAPGNSVLANQVGHFKLRLHRYKLDGT